MKILDATAGNRAVWFDKQYPDAEYIDIRDTGDARNQNMDCRHTSYEDGEFDLVVFDPPHGVIGPNGAMATRYGHYTTQEILDLVRDSFTEFHRILKPDGLVAFKWSTHDMKLERVLALTSGFDRLVGVPTAMRSKHASVTYWCLLRRVEQVAEEFPGGM